MIYFIQAGENGPIKIGSSINSMARMADLQTAHYEILRLLMEIEGDRDGELEFHHVFHRDKIRGEWFRPERIKIWLTSVRADRARGTSISADENILVTLHGAAICPTCDGSGMREIDEEFSEICPSCEDGSGWISEKEITA